MTDNGMIEAFRSDASFVMPECLYQASMSLLLLFVLLLVIIGMSPSII